MDVGNDDVRASGHLAHPEWGGPGRAERPLSLTQLVFTLSSGGVVELLVLHGGDVELSWISEGVQEVIIRDERLGKVSAEMSWWWE